MNQINVIYPYPTNYGWAFDDERTGLVGEPFVSGMPAIIDAALQAQNMDRKKFRLTFSFDFFPDFQLKMQLEKTDVEAGNYYSVVEGPPSLLKMKGWLCPATLKYFDDYPEFIFLTCEVLEE